MKRIIVLLLAMVMIFGLTACTQTGDDESTGDSASGEAQYGGTAVITLTGTYNVMGNPVTGGAQVKFACRPAIETLARYGEDGQAEPWLAKEIVTDPDNLTMTLTLQEGVTYHDGSAFNAQAVCDVWDIYRDNALLTTQFDNVDYYEATSEYVVTVYLTEWNAYTAIYLCIEAGYMISPTEYERVGLEGLNTSIVGTGPFVCESYDVVTGIEYVKNENYWGGEPYLDGINIVFHDESSVGENMLLSGEANIATWLTLDQLDRLVGNGYTFICDDSCMSPTCNGVFFASGNEDDPISNLLVRQAFCHAIDKEAIVAAFANGYGIALDQIAIPGTKEYNEDVEGYDYDVEKAKELLKEAGYDEGECVITFYYQSGEEDMYLAIKSMLEEAGFAVEGDNRTGSENRIIYGTSDPYTCCCLFYAPTTIDNWWRYFSATPFTYAVNTIDTAAAGIQAAYEGAMTAKTTEEMTEYMMLLQELVTENCMYCPIYSTPALIAVSDEKLQGHGIGEIWLCQWTPESAYLVG